MVKQAKPRVTKNSKKAQAAADVVKATTEGDVLDNLLGNAMSQAPVSPIAPPPQATDSVEPVTVPPFEESPPAKKSKTSKSKASSKASSSTDDEPKRKVAVPRAKDHEKIARNLSALKDVSSSNLVGSSSTTAQSDLGSDMMFVQRSEQIKSLFQVTSYALEESDSDALKIEKIKANQLSQQKAWEFMDKNLKVALDYSSALNHQKELNIATARETIVKSHEKSKNDSFKMTSNKLLCDLATGNSSDLVSMGTGTSSVFVAKTVSNVLPFASSLPLALEDEMNDPHYEESTPRFEAVDDNEEPTNK